jgi:Lar family restriction alleviation protein
MGIMSDVLKNCPFCGGNAVLRGDNDKSGYMISCWCLCSVSPIAFNHDREKVVEAWNKRHGEDNHE